MHIESCGLVVEKALNIWCTSFVGSPTPMSLTEINARPLDPIAT